MSCVGSIVVCHLSLSPEYVVLVVMFLKHFRIKQNRKQHKVEQFVN